LDPRPRPASCLTFTEPYAVPLGDLQLLVFDDSAAPDDNPPPAVVAAYTAQIAQVRALASNRAWFVSHMGPRVIGHLGVQNGVPPLAQDTQPPPAAGALPLPAAGQPPPAGHTPLVEPLSSAPPRPPQVVSGNAGTELDDPVTTPLEGQRIFDTTVAFAMN